MEDRVYIVTYGDDFSDLIIEGVFKDKSKAEEYCKCHMGCRVKEYVFKDNNVYTLFNIVRIFYDISLSNDSEDNIEFEFMLLTEEDDDEHNRNQEYIFHRYDNSIRIFVVRKLPSDYCEDEIKKEYTEALHGLRYKIMNTALGCDFNDFHKIVREQERIEKAIKGKIPILKE